MFRSYRESDEGQAFWVSLGLFGEGTLGILDDGVASLPDVNYTCASTMTTLVHRGLVDDPDRAAPGTWIVGGYLVAWVPTTPSPGWRGKPVGRPLKAVPRSPWDGVVRVESDAQPLSRPSVR